MAKRKLDIFLGVNNAEIKSKLTESINMFKAFKTTISGVLGGAALGLGAFSLGDFAKQASQVAVEMDGLTNKFTAASGGAEAGAHSMEFVRKECEELGMVFDSTARSYSGFEAATLRSGLTMQQTEEIFDGVARAATSLHLSGQRTELVFMALEQMASKGVVSMEELRRQLGDQLPGAFEIAAKAMGVSTQQFNKMVSNGEVMSADFLPKFAKAIKEQLGNQAELAATQTNAAFNRLKTSVYNLQTAVGEGLNPTLADLARTGKTVLDGATENIEKFREWAEVNNQTTNTITNGALALVTAVAGFQSLRVIVETVSKAHLAAVAAVQAETEATAALSYAKQVLAAEEVGLYQATLAHNAAQTAQTAQDLKQAQASYAATTAQVAKTTAMANSTKATVLQTAMTGNLTKALQLATVQARAFATALFTTPLGWAALAVGGLTAAFFTMKNSAESSQKAIEDLNNTHDQQVSKTKEAIDAVQELSKAENLNYEEKERLRKATEFLKNQFPEYAKRLEEEIALHGRINKELAEEIANKIALQKVEGLKKEQAKVEKVINRRGNYASYETADGTTHFQYEDDYTKKYNQLQKQITDAYTSRQNIVNSLTGVSSKTNASLAGVANSPADTKKKKSGSSDANKKRREEERQRREAIALRQAELDAEILQVRKNSEEEYKIELEKVNAKIALEKQGTAAYQQALNERIKLQQQHQQQVGEMDLAAYNNSVTLDNLKMERDRMVLDQRKELGTVSNEEYYNKLLEFEEKKYNLQLEGLNRQAELYKNDLQKYNEIQQQKLVLTAEYENQKLSINNEAAQAGVQTIRDALGKMGQSFKDNLGEFLAGNQTLKESYQNLFKDIRNAFIKMITEMMLNALKFQAINLMSGIAKGGGKGSGFFSAIGNITGWFADGGIVPGKYNQPAPIVAHGSEMVLNPLQQKTLWNMIASGAGAGTESTQNQNTGQQQPVIVNNITPVFQSLDPAQGQKMFTNWMKQSGVPIVRDSIKNNNFKMRDTIRGASG